MHRLLTGLSCILLLLGSATLSAQSNAGTISGRITSADGTAIPNAAITVTNVANNNSQKVLSGPDGTYSVSGLAFGTYRIDVDTPGYQRVSQQNVVLNSGSVTANITMTPGNPNEAPVNITATAPMPQSENAEVSLTLQTLPLESLPVIDRNHQQLAGLQSGITSPEAVLDLNIDPNRNRFYSTNGQFPFLNWYALDGVINQEVYRNTALRVPPEDSVMAFNLASSNLLVQKGFTPGTYALDASRTGGNTWHGDLFEIWSGNILRSRDFFDNADTGARRFNYNQFGGAVGGAIVPEHTFFFGSYEGQYNSGYNTDLSTVPVPAAITGNLSAIPGLTVYSPATGRFGAGAPFVNGMIPSAMINPAAAAIASFIPAPNLPGLVNNYVGNARYSNDYQKFDTRIDQRFGDKTNVFLRYGYSHNYTSEGSALGNVIGSGTDGTLVGQNALASLSHVFENQLVTDVNFGYNRYEQGLSLNTNQSPLAGLLGVTNTGNGLIGVNIPGMPFIGAEPWVPEHPIENTFNLVWNFSLMHGMHDLKWGADIRWIRTDGFLDSPFNEFGPNGTAFFGPGPTLLNNGSALSQYSEFYNSFASFLLGAPTQLGVSNFLVNPAIRQLQYGAWVGDSIHLTRRVVVDLGARYDIFAPLAPAHGGGAAYYDATTNTYTYAGASGAGMDFSNYQTHNIAPRVGVAFNLNDRTTIRAGYSIQYFQMPLELSGLMAPMVGTVSGIPGTYTSVPFTSAFGNTTSGMAVTLPLQNGAAAGNVGTFVLNRNIPTPYVQTYNLQVQRDFYWGTVLSVGYVGNVDRHLPGIEQLNAAMPGTGVAGLPFASLGQTGNVWGFDNGINSNYNSLQVNLNKRLSAGLQFFSSYTWSKALGYLSGGDMILNPFNLRSNYGPLPFDRQSMLTIGHAWEIPFGRHGGTVLGSLLGGWQFNGIFTWDTGMPLTLTADPLLCACPGLTALAGVNGAGAASVTTRFGNGQSYFANTNFYAPVGSNISNLRPGSFRGPDIWNYNMSLFKNFHVLDRFNLQLRGEAYNLFNTTQPLNPVTNINSPAFGETNGVLTGPFGRQLNIGIRAEF